MLIKACEEENVLGVFFYQCLIFVQEGNSSESRGVTANTNLTVVSRVPGTFVKLPKPTEAFIVRYPADTRKT